MDFYQSLGPLILGSRLRRVSEYFITEVNKVYQQCGIAFDASWFPVFYLLSEQDNISIREIAQSLQVSHSAVSQLVSNLKRKGLLDTVNCKEDGRRQLVQLTLKGKQLLADIQPIWSALGRGMQQLYKGHPDINKLLPSITALENEFAVTPLSNRIMQEIKTSIN